MASGKEQPDGRLLKAIAVFKFVKALVLIAVGVGAFNLLHKDVWEAVRRAIEALRLDPGSHFLDTVLSKASSVTPDQIKKLGLGSFIYAALFLTEGIGLWLMKVWAEWLTVIITSSLVPIELYGFHHHPTAGKILVLVLNLAIVVYLVYRIRSRRTAS